MTSSQRAEPRDDDPLRASSGRSATDYIACQGYCATDCGPEARPGWLLAGTCASVRVRP